MTKKEDSNGQTTLNITSKVRPVDRVNPKKSRKQRKKRRKKADQNLAMMQKGIQITDEDLATTVVP